MRADLCYCPEIPPVTYTQEQLAQQNKPRSFNDRFPNGSDADNNKSLFWQDKGVSFLKDSLPIGRGPGNAVNVYNPDYFKKYCGIYVNEQNQYLFGSQTDSSALLGTIQPCPDNLVSTLESWGQNIKVGDPFTEAQYDVLGNLTSDESARSPDAAAANVANCKDPTKTCKYTDWMTEEGGGLLGMLSFSHCDDGRGPTSSTLATNPCPIGDWVDSDPTGMPL